MVRGVDGGDAQTAERVEDRKPPLEPGTRLVVVSGPDKGKVLPLNQGMYTVGKLTTCDLVLQDPEVSRQHVELVVLTDAIRVRDLESRNGSYYQGAKFSTITIGVGGSVKIGGTELLVVSPREEGEIEIWEQNRFGPLLGISVAMRRVFARLARFVTSTSPVLIYGETGTGKELVAEALHSLSSRRDAPFLVCDLGAMSSTIIESELFGHVRGAFTSAASDRAGLVADAAGGTLFLDEIGELSLLDQPRLLRAIDRKQYRRVGSTTYHPIEARLVAATNRDLAVEVKERRFREDLYHRLAGLSVEMPPLRSRREDIPLYVEHFAAAVAQQQGLPAPEIPPAVHSALAAHDWPGNIRELRNVLERALILTPPGRPLDLGTLGLAPDAPPLEPESLQFHQAKSRLVDAWERDYVTELMHKSKGNVSLAARAGGISRPHLYGLLDKHGVAYGKE